MRMGEILSLSWRGVDLTRRTVMLFHSKNSERRTIPLNQTMLSLMKAKKDEAHFVIWCSRARLEHRLKVDIFGARFG
ncbi:MAG: tyrosine-type recombinase/integrase [Nitrospira sp.]